MKKAKKKLRILVVDNSNLVINEYKNNYEEKFKDQGYNLELTYCRDANDFDKDKSKEFDISFVDYWFFKDHLSSIKSDQICLVTSSEDPNILKYASKNKYWFMYKPYNIKKIINLISRFTYGSVQ